MIGRKKMSFYNNWLTIYNIIRVVYSKYNNPTWLYFFDWIEPIAGYFYLKINILLHFITIF